MGVRVTPQPVFIHDRPRGPAFGRRRAELEKRACPGSRQRKCRQRDAALLDRAAEGEEIFVTRFGKPYVRILPAKQPRSFLGAGKPLRQKSAVSPHPISASEWKRLK